MDLRAILKNKNSLNLLECEQRLILIALIKTKFNVKEAFKINCKDGGFHTYDTYYKLYKKHFPLGVQHLKKEFFKQLQFEEDLDGNFFKIK